MKQSGFTLIEIIVVLIILGVIASLAVTSYFEWIETARQAEALATIKNLRSRAEAFLLSHSNPVGIETSSYQALGVFSSNELSSENFNYVVGFDRDYANPNSTVILVSAIRNCNNGGNPIYHGNGGILNFMFFGEAVGNNGNLLNSSYCGFGSYNNLHEGWVDCSSGWTSWVGIYGPPAYVATIVNDLPHCS